MFFMHIGKKHFSVFHCFTLAVPFFLKKKIQNFGWLEKKDKSGFVLFERWVMWGNWEGFGIPAGEKGLGYKNR